MYLMVSGGQTIQSNLKTVSMVKDLLQYYQQGPRQFRPVAVKVELKCGDLRKPNAWMLSLYTYKMMGTYNIAKMCIVQWWI